MSSSKYRSALPLLILLAGCVHGEAANDSSVAGVDAEVIGSGEDIVLVPGLSGSALPWADTAQRLSRSHRVHVVRIGGLGKAGQAPAVVLSTSELADELAAYLQEHARPPATVVGHSAGGVAVLALALRHPQLVERAVVVDALPFMSANRGSNEVDDALRAAAKTEHDAVMAESGDAFRGRMADQAKASMRDDAMAGKIAAESAQSHRATYASIGADLMTLDLRPSVRSMKVPLTVIFADQAALGAPPGFMAKRYAAQYEGSGATLVEVRDARHYVMLDQPGEFALALDKALGDGRD